ncbi:MAG: hypothetical protein WCL08_02275 [Verrucomicrobiota bacterium]
MRSNLQNGKILLNDGVIEELECHALSALNMPHPEFGITNCNPYKTK